MSSTYEPGRPCIATVKGQHGIRVMRSARASTNGLVWASSVAVNGNWWFTEAEVTNVRPLVVLDLDDWNLYGCSAVAHDPAKIVAALMDTNSVAAHGIARQIEQQTATPPEPTEGTIARITGKTLKSASVIFAEWTRGEWRYAGGERVDFGPGGIKVLEVVRPGIEDGAS